jgi:hypothetical protein
LDTTNARPAWASSRGPEIAHGITPERPPHGSVRQSVRPECTLPPPDSSVVRSRPSIDLPRIHRSLL